MDSKTSLGNSIYLQGLVLLRKPAVPVSHQDKVAPQHPQAEGTPTVPARRGWKELRGQILTRTKKLV